MKANIRTRIAAVVIAAVSAVVMTLAMVTPASALTLRGDVSYEGGGNDLVACSTIGSNAEFMYIPSGCFSGSLDYQALGTSGGSTYYYIHPHGWDDRCITIDTSDYNQNKVEYCVAAWNQYWHNPNDTHGDYRIYSAGGGVYLDDPGAPGTTHWAHAANDIGWGYNGETFYEPA